MWKISAHRDWEKVNCSSENSRGNQSRFISLNIQGKEGTVNFTETFDMYQQPERLKSLFILSGSQIFPMEIKFQLVQWNERWHCENKCQVGTQTYHIINTRTMNWEDKQVCWSRQQEKSLWVGRGGMGKSVCVLWHGSVNIPLQTLLRVQGLTLGILDYR